MWNFGKRARMTMWWLRRGKTCNSRFVHNMTSCFFLHFFPHTLPFELFYINETESKLVPPPTQHTWRFIIQNSKSSVCFHPHAAADRTALCSTRPTSPQWCPSQRRAQWGPPYGRSSLPLSSSRLRGAEVTWCYSSSSADHHPPELGTRERGKKGSERNKYEMMKGCVWEGNDREAVMSEWNKEKVMWKREIRKDNNGLRNGRFVNQLIR